MAEAKAAAPPDASVDALNDAIGAGWAALAEADKAGFIAQAADMDAAAKAGKVRARVLCVPGARCSCLPC